MARPKTPAAAILLVLASLSACASSGDAEAEQIAAVEARHRAELHAFEAEKRRFASTLDLAAPIDFGPKGQILVRDVELIGWPGSAYLHAEFTWVNTGKRTRRPPLVRLSIIDPANDDWRSETIELVTTFGLEYGSGSTYTSWLDVPTDGLYRRAGWTWSIELISQDAEG